MNPKICPKCGSDIDFGMSDVHLLNIEETAIEGLCEKCLTHVYLTYKLDKIKVTEFDEFMQEMATRDIDYKSQ